MRVLRHAVSAPLPAFNPLVLYYHSPALLALDERNSLGIKQEHCGERERVVGSSPCPLLTVPLYMAALEKFVFAFSASQQGVTVPLQKYKGQVTLIVNTASRCSFTAYNLDVLNDVQRLYASRGFTVLAFPCSQFANQEPLNNGELSAWQKEMSIGFPVFDKVDVKGKNADPLFVMLQESLGKARWNWSKYLCDRTGRPVQRFEAHSPPPLLRCAVEAIL